MLSFSHTEACHTVMRGYHVSQQVLQWDATHPQICQNSLPLCSTECQRALSAAGWNPRGKNNVILSCPSCEDSHIVFLHLNQIHMCLIVSGRDDANPSYPILNLLNVIVLHCKQIVKMKGHCQYNKFQLYPGEEWVLQKTWVLLQFSVLSSEMWNVSRRW